MGDIEWATRDVGGMGEVVHVGGDGVARFGAGEAGAVVEIDLEAIVLELDPAAWGAFSYGAIIVSMKNVGTKRERECVCVRACETRII